METLNNTFSIITTIIFRTLVSTEKEKSMLLEEVEMCLSGKLSRKDNNMPGLGAETEIQQTWLRAFLAELRTCVEAGRQVVAHSRTYDEFYVADNQSTVNSRDWGWQMS